MSVSPDLKLPVENLKNSVENSRKSVENFLAKNFSRDLKIILEIKKI